MSVLFFFEFSDSSYHKMYKNLLSEFLLFAYTTKQAKSISYLQNLNFDCHFLTKSPIQSHESYIIISIRQPPNLLHRYRSNNNTSSKMGYVCPIGKPSCLQGQFQVKFCPWVTLKAIKICGMVYYSSYLFKKNPLITLVKSI